MLTQPQDQMPRVPDTATVKDTLDFLRRRIWLCLSVGAVIFASAVVLAFKLPPVYMSQATILIEQPAIPEDFIPSTIRSYVDEQIQIVSQRVYTAESVLEMVDRFDLFPDERGIEDSETTVDRFVNSTYLENLTAEVTDDRGKTSDSTFAFIVGFHHGEPEIAQQVSAELAQRFLDENVRSRRERAGITTSFLEQEADRLASEIAEIETRIAAFKDEYGDALPDQLNLNMGILDRVQTELSRTDQQLRELRAEQQIIQSTMRTLDPYAIIFSESGEPVFSAEQRLAELRQQYLQLSSRYGPEHPDVVRTKREIEAIVGGGNIASVLGSNAQQRATLIAERDRLLDRYSPEHPDVVRVQRAIDALPEGDSTDSGRNSNALPNNPAYLQAQARLRSVESGLVSADQRRRELMERRARLERNIAGAPRIEQEWLQLNRGYESARLEYEEIKRRSTEARLSENLEVQNKGERFTLLKRAGRPTAPVEPNRPAIIFLGFVLALGISIGLAALVDAMDSTIRSAHDLQSRFALQPIATIPYVQSLHDQRLAWTKRATFLGAAIVGVLIVATLI